MIDPDALAVVDRRTAAVAQARDLLLEALNDGDVARLVELRSQAQAIEAYTAQRDTGREAGLAAAEIVRRAERAIGVAIREGQQNGTIRRRCPPGDGEHHDQVSLPGPGDFGIDYRVLAGGGQDSPGIYRLTDGVTDEQFEAAIEKAKQEQNLSRANMVRKVSGRARPPSTRSEWNRGHLHIRVERVMETTIGALEGVASGLTAIESHIPSIDVEKRLEWLNALRQPLSTIEHTLKELSR